MDDEESGEDTSDESEHEFPTLQRVPSRVDSYISHPATPSTPSTAVHPNPPYYIAYGNTPFGYPVPNPYQHLYNIPHQSLPPPSPSIPPSGTPRAGPSTAPHSTASGRKKPKTVKEKADLICQYIQQLGWTYGDFLYHTLRGSYKDEDGKFVEPKRGQTHSNMVSKFLAGQCKVTLAPILEELARHPWGLPPERSNERIQMFSTTTHYRDLSYARPVLTTFCGQMVEEQLLVEVRNATHIGSGLHSFATEGSDIASEEYGAEAIEGAKAVFLEHAPLSFRLLTNMAAPKPRNRRSRAKNAEPGMRAQAKNDRPPETVVTFALSSIMFSRNQRANLLPLTKGLLMYSCSANKYLWSLESRIGGSVSYDAVLRLFRKLGQHDGKIVKAIHRSLTRALMLRFDNVQKYRRLRYTRVGRHAHMITGTAGTVFELEGFIPEALDMDIRRQYIDKNLRKDLTFDSFWDKIDHQFLDIALEIEWIRTLIEFVPELKVYEDKLKELSQSKGTKRKLSTRKTRIYPLPTTSFSETSTPEMNKAIRKLAESMGITPEDFIRRVLIAGGDGLSFERLVQLINYLQFQNTEFERLEFLMPILESWHTLWTDLSRIYEAHWDSLTSSDPAAMGRTANTINLRAPASLQKVEFYKYNDFAQMDCRARMLDCWRIILKAEGGLQTHFQHLARIESLPSFQDLQQRAHSLRRLYGSPASFHYAMNNEYPDDLDMPRGTPWTQHQHDSTSAAFAPPSSSKGKSKGHKKKKSPPQSPFIGDETLARSTRCIYDVMLSSLAQRSVKIGDVGCLWEIMKILTVSFAGSSHKKYSAYLLEMFCSIELESSPELQNVFFENYIVDVSGLPENFECGDLFQEQIQDEFYDQLGDYDGEFDSPHVAEVIAPNTYRTMQCKKHIHRGLGLAKRSGNHAKPEAEAELRRMIHHHETNVVHLLRECRSYSADHETRNRYDHSGHGVQDFQSGKIEKWAQETARIRSLRADGFPKPASMDAVLQTVFVDPGVPNPVLQSQDPQEYFSDRDSIPEGSDDDLSNGTDSETEDEDTEDGFEENQVSQMSHPDDIEMAMDIDEDEDSGQFDDDYDDLILNEFS